MLRFLYSIPVTLMAELGASRDHENVERGWVSSTNFNASRRVGSRVHRSTRTVPAVLEHGAKVQYVNDRRFSRFADTVL